MIRLARTFVPKSLWPSVRLERFVAEWAGAKVSGGIFAGLHYVSASHGSVLLPKLLGTYEKEVQKVFTRWGDVEFDQIVVAGAAEGYYAVGLARRYEHASVIAYEAASQARQALHELAVLNGCESRVTARGLCSCSALAADTANARLPLVIVDIEGGETLLLDPEVVPALSRSFILVEVHDMMVPASGAALQARFATTHRIERIDSIARTQADVPPALLAALPRLLRSRALDALNEWRPPGMYWLAMSPHGFAPTSALS